MQGFSSYQEKRTNITNINGKEDIKQLAMDYYKEDNHGEGEIRLRDNNIEEKISFDDKNMNSVVNYLKNRKKNTSSIENRLNLFSTRKKARKKVNARKVNNRKVNTRKVARKARKVARKARKVNTRKARKVNTRKARKVARKARKVARKVNNKKSSKK